MSKILKALRILNFQCHKQTEIELDEHVTLLFGVSDQGKSSILRALRWVFFNKPSGDSFVPRYWKGFPSVEVEDEDGVSVARMRDKSNNTYLLDGEELRAFGKGVPEPVQDFLAVDETNWQTQFDSPYLISSTPTEVAKRLNAVANLEDIDVVLANVDNETRAHKREVTQRRADKARLEVERARLPDTREAEKMLKHLKQKRDELKDVRAQLSAVTRIAGQLRDALKALRRVPDTSGMDLSAIQAKLSLRNHARSKWAQLMGVQDGLVDVGAELDALPPASAAKALSSIAARIATIDTLRSTCTKLGAARRSYATARREWEISVEAYHRLDAEWADTFPDVCPLCNQEVSK